jgi:predicted RNase H-like nuclease
MSEPGPFVVGVDGWRKAWVAAVLRAGRFVTARVFLRFADLLGEFSEAAAIGVDIPIGIPESGTRSADLEARTFLSRGRSSVFLVPSRDVLEAVDHATASALHRSRTGKGVSQQSYALRVKILEVDALVNTDDNVIEIHPEVSFRALAGHPLGYSKKTWAGAHLRRRLLVRAGIVLPDDLGPAGVAPVDDVLDAAAAAWSAQRYASGEARSLPADPPEDARGRPVAIWY